MFLMKIWNWSWNLIAIVYQFLRNSDSRSCGMFHIQLLCKCYCYKTLSFYSDYLLSCRTALLTVFCRKCTLLQFVCRQTITRILIAYFLLLNIWHIWMKLGGEVCSLSESTYGRTLDSRLRPKASAFDERLWADPNTDFRGAECRILLQRYVIDQRISD